MFLTLHLNFGCHLQCCLLLESMLDVIYNGVSLFIIIFATICNGVCSSSSFWVVFTTCVTIHINLSCYLKCCLLFISISVIIYKCSQCKFAFLVIFEFFVVLHLKLGCYLQRCYSSSQFWLLFTTTFALEGKF